MPVKVSMDRNAVKMRIRAASEKAVAELSKQVLADCNEFCPEDHGILINSSEIHSNFKKGLLVWSTPYARYLYYGILMIDPVTRSPYAHKGARKILTNMELQYHGGKSPCKLWCEKAREMYNEDWRLIYQNAFKKYMR